MIAAAIYGTRWEKIEKKKRTKHYMGCHVVGQDKDSRVARRLHRRAPGSAVIRDCCFGFAPMDGARALT